MTCLDASGLLAIHGSKHFVFSVRSKFFSRIRMIIVCWPPVGPQDIKPKPKPKQAWPSCPCELNQFGKAAVSRPGSIGDKSQQVLR